MPPSIFDYIKSEEARFETGESRVGENWNWNFRKHVQMLFHLKNGVFFTGENDWLRPFKNIMEPIVDLANWTEDIELKDITFFIESDDGKVLSFLIKKYHDEVFARKYNIDEMIDDITDSDNSYGGVLVQDTNTIPEVLPLNTIAFCDQSDLLGGPLALKASFSPSKLRKMEKAGWGKDENGATISINDLITLATFDKEPVGTANQKKNQTTGKNIDVYILKGDLPEAYLKDNDNMDEVYPQVQVVAFYTDKNSKRQGVVLYRKKDKGESLMSFSAEKVNGRALGRGVGEKILPDQIWTNWANIHYMNMLEAGSKSPLYTDDENFSDVNSIKEQDNLTINKVAQGTRIGLVPTLDANKVQLFDRAIDSIFQHAQLSGQANDPILGKEAVSGTTFRGQERTVAQGKGSHDRRRGRRAKFIEEIYRKYIIDKMVKEILNGKEFLAELSSDEMDWVVDQLAEQHAYKTQIDDLFNAVMPEQKEILKQEFKNKVQKKGNKFLVKILKDEFRDIEVKIGINVANKQKDLALLSDKILSLFQFIFANTEGFVQAMKVPALAKSFSDILEFSGLSAGGFGAFMSSIPSPVQPTQQPAQQAELLTPQVNAQ